MKNVVKLFLEIVKINSPSSHEEQMVDYVKKWLDSIKLPYLIDKKGNIIAKNIGTGKPSLFCVHLDTVKPGQGIKPIINNGIIKSSGKTILGADNKAAVSALMIAIEEYLLEKNKLNSFEILFTVEEENGSGLTNFNFKNIKSKQGFIFDSIKPIGSIILRSPHICLFKAEFKGKASHSSTPEKGINALLPAIKALNIVPVGKINNGETTINIGLVNCGTCINIVPEKVIIEGEIRSYSKKLFESHINKLKSIFKNSQLNFSGFAPGYIHKESEKLTKKVVKVYQTLNINPLFFNDSAVSDANILNFEGIKIINLGDGVENAHTVDEHIKIEELNKLKKIILNLLSFNQ